MLRVHYLHKRHGRPAREALIALEIRGHSFHDPFHATSGGRLLQPWASSDALGGRTFVSCREPASVSPLLSSDVDQTPVATHQIDQIWSHQLPVIMRRTQVLDAPRATP